MRIGDIVRLKSGGPKMTVSGEGGDGDDVEVVTCTWFGGADADDGPFLDRDFAIDVLEIVTAGPPKRKPKLLVTERESDLTAAKHELDKYLEDKKPHRRGA